MTFGLSFFILLATQFSKIRIIPLNEQRNILQLATLFTARTSSSLCRGRCETTAFYVGNQAKRKTQQGRAKAQQWVS